MSEKPFRAEIGVRMNDDERAIWNMTFAITLAEGANAEVAARVADRSTSGEKR